MLTEIHEEITALVDGEISDRNKVKELNELIDRDSSLAFERDIQLCVKTLFSNNCSSVKAPKELENLIMSKILNS